MDTNWQTGVSSDLYIPLRRYIARDVGVQLSVLGTMEAWHRSAEVSVENGGHIAASR